MAKRESIQILVKRQAKLSHTRTLYICILAVLAFRILVSLLGLIVVVASDGSLLTDLVYELVIIALAGWTALVFWSMIRRLTAIMNDYEALASHSRDISASFLKVLLPIRPF